jgi:hypothetical protein
VPSRRSTDSKSPGSTPVEKTSLHSTSSTVFGQLLLGLVTAILGMYFQGTFCYFQKTVTKSAMKEETELCGACLKSLTRNEPKRLAESRFLKLRRLLRCLRARFARAQVGWIPNFGNIELERSMLDIERWYRYDLELFHKDTNNQ